MDKSELKCELNFFLSCTGCADIFLLVNNGEMKAACYTCAVYTFEQFKKIEITDESIISYIVKKIHNS